MKKQITVITHFPILCVDTIGKFIGNWRGKCTENILKTSLESNHSQIQIRFSKKPITTCKYIKAMTPYIISDFLIHSKLPILNNIIFGLHTFFNKKYIFVFSYHKSFWLTCQPSWYSQNMQPLLWGNILISQPTLRSVHTTPQLRCGTDILTTSLPSVTTA